MKRVGAIGRLMAAVAPVVAAFSIYRAWADPWMTVRDHPLGEMALASLVVLPSAALAIAFSGKLPRFFGRFAAAGAVISASCWLAPNPIREAILARVLIPIDRRFATRESEGLTELEVCLLTTGYTTDIVPPVPRPYRSPPAPQVPFSRESMVELGIRQANLALTTVEMSLALALVLLDSTFRAFRRRPTTPPPPMRPEPL